MRTLCRSLAQERKRVAHMWGAQKTTMVVDTIPSFSVRSRTWLHSSSIIVYMTFPFPVPSRFRHDSALICGDNVAAFHRMEYLALKITRLLFAALLLGLAVPIYCSCPVSLSSTVRPSSMTQVFIATAIKTTSCTATRFSCGLVYLYS